MAARAKAEPADPRVAYLDAALETAQPALGGRIFDLWLARRNDLVWLLGQLPEGDPARGLTRFNDRMPLVRAVADAQLGLDVLKREYAALTGHRWLAEDQRVVDVSLRVSNYFRPARYGSLR